MKSRTRNKTDLISSQKFEPVSVMLDRDNNKSVGILVRVDYPTYNDCLFK